MKKSLKIQERTWKATSFHISSPPYILSNSVKWGVSGSTPDLWEFSENGDHVDAWQMKKNLQVHKAFFDRKKSAPIIQGMVQGVLGGGENPFSPHDFFYFFYFLLSKFESGITREKIVKNQREDLESH